MDLEYDLAINIDDSFEGGGKGVLEDVCEFGVLVFFYIYSCFFILSSVMQLKAMLVWCLTSRGTLLQEPMS